MIAAFAIGAAGLVTSSCSRTGLELYASERPPGALDELDGSVAWTDGGSPPPAPLADGAIPPVPTSHEPPPSSSNPRPRDPPTFPGCTPSDETCNGRDDDCDGDIDEIPPIACPGGGSRYCVAGRMSECPTRCEACMPGSERVCFLSYCTYWGVQTCAADGRGFGRCREAQVPPECEHIIDTHKNSPELEQCCIDNGYCCLDEFDLDDDGNRRELLGRCDEVLCQ